MITITICLVSGNGSVHFGLCQSFRFGIMLFLGVSHCKLHFWSCLIKPHSLTCCSCLIRAYYFSVMGMFLSEAWNISLSLINLCFLVHADLTAPLHLLETMMWLWKRALSSTLKLLMWSSTAPTVRPYTAWQCSVWPSQPASTNTSGPSPCPVAVLALERHAMSVAGDLQSQINVSGFKGAAVAFTPH